MHIFGVTVVWALRNLKCSSIGWLVEAELARDADAFHPALHALKLDAVVELVDAPRRRACRRNRNATTSGGIRRRSRPWSPTSSCFLMIFSISRSSTSLSCAALISPFSRLARASFSGAVRRNEPTTSARNGGLVSHHRAILLELLGVRNKPGPRVSSTAKRAQLASRWATSQRPLLLYLKNEI